jgi:prepilin signal peptidase PulO-like enzyme (type II secretory pathway)
MGFLAVLASLKAGLNIEIFSIFSFFHFIIILAIFATILLISVYDLHHFIIPDTFLGWFLVLVILHNFLFFKPFLILQYLLAGVLVMLPFGLIFLISRGRWLGLGDVKYMLVIGLFLGLSIGFSAVIMAFWIGAGFSIFFIGFRYLKKYFNLPSWVSNLTIKSEIPFGPFLSLGIIISFCFSIDLFQIQNLFNVF